MFGVRLMQFKKRMAMFCGDGVMSDGWYLLC